MFQPVLMLVLVAAGIFYAINALNTQDWLWFRAAATNPPPDRILIRHDGQLNTIAPGHPAYQELATAAQAALHEISNTDLISIGLSPETLATYQLHGLVVELHYDNPIQFHSLARTGKPTQVLIPLEGRHAGNGYFFRGDKGTWWYGAMRMADPAPLLQAMARLGYPVAQAGP